MASIIQIAAPGEAAPGVSFDSPLDMLQACHRRIEQQCATLLRLVPHLQTHGSDAAAAQAAAAVLRYFDTAALLHHADEEEDLFPALLESMAGSDAICLRTLTDTLEQAHVTLGAQWRGLQTVLRQVSAGAPGVLDAQAVKSFVQAYADHIALEEQELLPMAQRLLSEQSLRDIGAAMRQRRNTP